MLWLWITAGGVASLVIAYKLLMRKAGPPLLAATVATIDGYYFTVNFKKVHPDAQPVEFVRLILLLASKMIFNTSVERPPVEAQRIIEWMYYLSEAALAPETQLQDLNPLWITVDEVASPKGRKIVATLGLMSHTYRSIHTSIPAVAFPDQSLNTWLAVVQTTLPKLSPAMVAILRNSLARMLQHYRDGNADPASLRALVEVPNLAFIEVTSGLVQAD